ncbi:D-2-hydroxyacid dehydrogenase [Verrucomicrobiales bacterium]|nr:D-2-hydroxyacid dehydrogenase [Verrucomicrobiales bacterium]
MNTPPKIVFLDRDTTDADDIDFSEIEASGEFLTFPITSPNQVNDRIADAEIVMMNKVVINGDAMDAAPNLKLIQVVATGVNNVDLEAAKSRGIAVCNVSGYSTPGVVQHTFTLILNLMTNVHRFAAEPEKWAASPHFTRLDFPVSELAGKTLGIAGLGSIGGAVADVAEAFGMRVIGLARDGAGSSGDRARLERAAFFAEADVISLHCPLTDDTHHLINSETLSQMKSSAILINTGRGDLVNEPDLLAALKAGEIAGAGLDVLSAEPPASGHPLLERLPNLLITPHTAWSSIESRVRLIEGVASNLRAFLNGEKENRVV